MELTNEFVVAAPLEEVWKLLTDVERIAPCIPGFELTESTGDEYRGTMKLRVGAVTAKYEASVRFVERDETAHRAVMAAQGKETHGQGGVTATITSTLTPEGDKTRAKMVTDLAVTGRVAQFGRSILGDVSNRLVDQFVTCLETTLLAGGSTTAPANGDSGSAAGESADPVVRQIEMKPAQPIDLLAVAGRPMLKRLAPLAALFFAIALGLRRCTHWLSSRQRTTP